MPLSDKEQQMLEQLTKKSKEPEAPPVGKSISANIDLSDDKQIERAIEHGFLTKKEAEELKDDDDDDDSDSKTTKTKTATPRRKGYFKEKTE